MAPIDKNERHYQRRIHRNKTQTGVTLFPFLPLLLFITPKTYIHRDIIYIYLSSLSLYIDIYRYIYYIYIYIYIEKKKKEKKRKEKNKKKEQKKRKKWLKERRKPSCVFSNIGS